MAKVCTLPCFFPYSKYYYKKESSDSTQQILKVFILFNYVYFSCLVVLFLYDVLLCKIFSHGRFVLLNCFKKCEACEDLKNLERKNLKSNTLLLVVYSSRGQGSKSKSLDESGEALSPPNQEDKIKINIVEVPKPRINHEECYDTSSRQDSLWNSSHTNTASV